MQMPPLLPDGDDAFLIAALSLLSVAAMALAGLLIGIWRLSESVDRTERAIDAHVERRLAEAVAVTKGGLIAAITGSNAGIGLCLAQRLAVAGAKVVMLCRSLERGEAAVKKVEDAVLEERGRPAREGSIVLIQCDVSDPDSVRRAATAMSRTLPRLDLLYLNAGYYPSSGFSWLNVASAFVGCVPLYFMETGRVTPSGPHVMVSDASAEAPGPHGEAPRLLATNVLGHALLTELCAESGLLAAGRVPLAVREGDRSLLPIVHGGDSDLPHVRTPEVPQGAPVGELWVRPDHGTGGTVGGRVVWTGSRSAKGGMDLRRLAAGPGRGARAPQPYGDGYGASKRLVDALAAALGRRLREGEAYVPPPSCLVPPEPIPVPPAPGVETVVICPGYVSTSVAPGFFRAFSSINEVFRPFLCGMQITPRRGAEPLLAMALLGPGTAVPGLKYITHRGMLTTARNGWEPVTEEDEAAALDVVESWFQDAGWRE